MWFAWFAQIKVSVWCQCVLHGNSMSWIKIISISKKKNIKNGYKQKLMGLSATRYIDQVCRWYIYLKLGTFLNEHENIL